MPEIAALAPSGDRRMSANPHANGGVLLRDLPCQTFESTPSTVPKPGESMGEATRVLGGFLRDVMRQSADQRNFRIVAPDELVSNRLGAVLEVTDRAWMAERLPDDDHLAPDGRVMEMLSETTCQGWLEGYLLTGRHGLFTTYEAFVHIVDSMFNQHAKWLEASKQIPGARRWRRSTICCRRTSGGRTTTASRTRIRASSTWHEQEGPVIRVYLPPDANTLLSMMDHCLRSRDYINIIVAGKQPALQYLDMDAAITHCTAGIGIWEWASSDRGTEPDVVMACAGDMPTLETLAAVELLRTRFRISGFGWSTSSI